MAKRGLLFYLFTFLLFSCTTDSYETGTGQYSLMQADLCNITVDATKNVTSLTTDDGDRYALAQPVTATWIETPDTTYRALAYYNKVGETQAEVLALGTVPTLVPREHWLFEEQPQDPIGLESAWLSRTGRYINLGLLVRTGRIDDEELPHIIGVAQDTVLVNPDGTRTAHYRLLHSQNGAPEYYTNRRYASILLPDADRPDTVRLTLQTYDGQRKRVIPVP